MIEIKEVKSSSIDVYKKLLTKGLLGDEECFRIAPEDEELEGFPTQDRSDSFTLGGFEGERLVGVASFKRDGSNRIKLRHKGILFKIYVDTDYRKQGLAKRLIQSIIDRVKNIKDIEQINLTVVPTNQHAKALYEHFGFNTFASEERAIKWKGKYFTEDQMQLRL